MNLLNRLTLTSMKLNRKRTIVTIIGVILATAMITTVSILVTSTQASLVNYAMEENGRWHYEFDGVDSRELGCIENNRQIEAWYVTKLLGYAQLEGSKNEYKPYMKLLAFDSGAMENTALKLLEGRMPQNENEVVISKHIRTNGRVAYKVGDTLNLALGERKDSSGNQGFIGGYEPGEEEIEVTDHKTYKIVGLIERPSRMIEPFSEAGYTVITCLEPSEIEGKVNVFAYYTREGLKDRNAVAAGLEEAWSDCGETTNQTLVRYQALAFGNGIMRMILLVAGIVLLIIIFTAVFCIRNSFAISITERMRQYGMLASVGATSKQIARNVFFEAFLIGLIGIPFGIGSGILASFVLLRVCDLYFSGTIFSKFVFSMSPIPIAGAAILAYVTIFISAGRVAKRASKVSPLEAIRAAGDTGIKAGKVRSPKWIKRCFGIGGELADKNLRRSRKKYRTTVISIVVSVALFIGMWSFVRMAFGTIGMYYTNYSYNLSLEVENREDEQTLMQALRENELVEKCSLIHGYDSIWIPAKEVRLAPRYADYMYMDAEVQDEYIEIIALEKDAYAAYAKEAGITAKEAENKAILTDMNLIMESTDKGNVYLETRKFAYQKGDTLSFAANGEDDIVEHTVSIAAVTEKKPFGRDNYRNMLVMSEELAEQLFKAEQPGEIYIEAKDADKLEQQLESDFDTQIAVIDNLNSSARQEKSFYMMFSIFLYGFITVISLIGVTNIFNTITTNMELRSREFATLRSVGMTKKEFSRMIRLESLFYGTKSLLFGIPLGIALSVLLHRAFTNSAEFKYTLPVGGIVIAAAAVFVLITCIMRYSMNRINRQNIIETIRNENI